MRRLPLLTLFATVTFAQTPATAPAMTTYRSATPAFTYSYPADFLVREDFTAMVADGLKGRSSQADSVKFDQCVKYPVTASKGINARSTTGIGMVVVLQLDHKCLGTVPSAEFREQLAQQLMQLLSGFGRPLTEDARRYDLDGQPAAFAQGTAAAKAVDGNFTAYGVSACALLPEATVCWFLADSNYKRMPQLVGAPVSFRGRPPVPLIPANLLQPW